MYKFSYCEKMLKKILKEKNKVRSDDHKIIFLVENSIIWNHKVLFTWETNDFERNRALCLEKFFP